MVNADPEESELQTQKDSLAPCRAIFDVLPENKHDDCVNPVVLDYGGDISTNSFNVAHRENKNEHYSKGCHDGQRFLRT